MLLFLVQKNVGEISKNSAVKNFGFNIFRIFFSNAIQLSNFNLKRWFPQNSHKNPNQMAKNTF